MKILQPRFIFFFFGMLIIPAGVSYVAGWDRNVDALFFGRAFSIAFFITVLYYLLIKRQEEKRSNRSKGK